MRNAASRLIGCLLVPLCLLASAAQGQEARVVIDAGQAIEAPKGAIFRGLDRLNGQTRDIEIGPGETVTFERLELRLKSCTYPRGSAEVEGFAHLTVRDTRQEEAIFSGWMFASSPALFALDHSRYDVWLLRCKI